MAELGTATCCSPAEQETCCEPEAKSECCGERHDEGCGCSEGTAATSEAGAIREAVRAR